MKSLARIDSLYHCLINYISQFVIYCSKLDCRRWTPANSRQLRSRFSLRNGSKCATSAKSSSSTDNPHNNPFQAYSRRSCLAQRPRNSVSLYYFVKPDEMLRSLFAVLIHHWSGFALAAFSYIVGLCKRVYTYIYIYTMCPASNGNKQQKLYEEDDQVLGWLW